MDIYFCYAINSKYKPKERHFLDLSEDITPKGIAFEIKKIIAKLEELKELSFKEKCKKAEKYKAMVRRKGTKLYH